ncbi:hypothetical protein [Roseateles koreensis]|uniref:Uncharacterized protein n=1 Tax=Roseateles koreensis TaxID=2987526 RepID=A0ABT5KUY3_9BURK|nr:hypothetical protein [Roseateles koreensis]MDC8786738.1 hypothetical protein [Roseateles koreensis]
MNLIAITWGYVALMMALAEATSTQGSILGAVITFLLYGVLPIAILHYILGSPGRRALSKKRALLEETGDQAPVPTSTQGNGGDHAPTGRLPAEGKEP